MNRTLKRKYRELSHLSAKMADAVIKLGNERLTKREVYLVERMTYVLAKRIESLTNQIEEIEYELRSIEAYHSNDQG